MKIPIKYYIKFYLKNSLLASATGFVFGLLIPFIPFSALLGLVVGLLVYQFVVFRYFKGAKRGHFEYHYRAEVKERAVRRLVKLQLGMFTFIRYFLDSFNNISYFQLEVCKKLIRFESISKNTESKFSLYIKMSSLCLKDDNFQQEINYLSDALKIDSDDFLANYRLAVALEKNGSGGDAINHYQRALNDEDAISDQLKSFINEQIERVKTKGPMNKPATLGLRFSSW